jgi:hypothetical protein
MNIALVCRATGGGKRQNLEWGGILMNTRSEEEIDISTLLTEY